MITSWISQKGNNEMLVAIPSKYKEFCLHFNNCDQFAIVKISTGTNQILDACFMTPPSFDYTALPGWFRENDIDIILAGGMDQHVRDFLAQDNIEVRIGFLESSIKRVIEKYISSLVGPGSTTEAKKF